MARSTSKTPKSGSSGQGGRVSRGFWRLPQAHAITDWKAAVYEQYHRDCGLPTDFVWATVTPGLFGPVFFTDTGGARFDAVNRRFERESRYVVDGVAGAMLTPSVVDATTLQLDREALAALLTRGGPVSGLEVARTLWPDHEVVRQLAAQASA